MNGLNNLKINNMDFGTKGCMYCVDTCNKECLKLEKNKVKSVKMSEDKDERTQELLKAAENVFTNSRENYKARRGFIEGANWQAERMYSEDEVDELVNNLISNFKNYNGSSIDSEKLKWFYQQLKKEII